MKKILLDTDIGSDIDDALCLAYLLAHPECELLGITTVSGEARQRAAMADAMCKHMGKDVPIFPGAEVPILGKALQPHAPQAAALGDWPRRETFPEGQAISFLRDTIRANPHEVELLAIGPMTNVGLLFALDPEIPALLKSLWLMCGVFSVRKYGNLLEWNAMNDPTATAVVYNARPPVHRSIGLDVTCFCQMKPDQARAAFKNARAIGPARDFAEVWFSSGWDVTFHDPLAAACIFNDSLCSFERGRVDIELSGPKVAGLTHWQKDGIGPHEIATEVNAEAFFEEYFRVVR